MLVNRALILYILGFLLLVEGIFMPIPGFVSLMFGDADCSFFFSSALVTLILGGILTICFRNHPKEVTKKDSYIIVTSVWLGFTLFGLLPFWLSGSLPTFVDAFFETMSGFTTTGSTMLSNIEEASHGVLFWRSLLQWLGGMGIIAMSLVLVPALGMSNMHTFSAEASVTRSDKIHPKVTEMAKYMWYLYIAMTVVEIGLLMLGGMSMFDATCHALSTISTGGFSTRNASIGAFNSPYVEYVTFVFMFMGGVNFALYYCLLTGKGERFLHDDEFKAYLLVIVFAGLLMSLLIYINGEYDSFETAIRHGLFNTVSVMTGTGFTVCDYMVWPVQTTTIIALLMFFGGCTGSTTGGIKLMRLTIMARNIKNELKRAVHPTAVVPVRYNGKSLMAGDVSSVLSFIVFYVLILIVGMLIISLCGCGLEDAFGLATNSLGNVGISIGSYGPSGTLCYLHPIAKVTMAILMLIGRLEIFTVILIFTPSFWKR